MLLKETTSPTLMADMSTPKFLLNPFDPTVNGFTGIVFLIPCKNEPITIYVGTIIGLNTKLIS